MKYRNLSQGEIEILIQNDCIAQDGWSNIHVVDNFTPEHIKSVTFSGENYLGLFTNKTEVRGILLYSGIKNAHLHNCTIKNNCYIHNIGTILADYTIEDNVILCNIDSIYISAESSFGNGILISPVNEAGGRELPIYEDLSVHTAYIQVFHRYKEKHINTLKQWVKEYSDEKKSSKGIIHNNTQIYNSGTIENVNIEEFSILNCITHLKNGTIKSSQDAPTTIGNNVFAEDFIILQGSKITDGANLQNCFVGQGCEIGNHFTAENSLFFANCQCLQGEACSVFAGPYTVTHHKSTLLIAGYYSFFNAGSGTNQSNHMYKLGPVHQGVLERGCKTGSDSYLVWPAHISPFTIVLGRHYGNPDVRDLPFSYLIEEGRKSILMPAQNIFSVGTTRDSEKWKARDKRKHPIYTDYIITEALNPYTINLILKAIKTLQQLKNTSRKQSKTIIYKNAQIVSAAVPRALRTYDQAVLKYTGDALIEFLKTKKIDDLKKLMTSVTKESEWIDLGGLICTKEDMVYIDNILEKSSNKIKDINKIYQNIFENYERNKTNHAVWLLKNYFDFKEENNFLEKLVTFFNNWMENNEKIYSSIMTDAKKEYNTKSKISYGLNSDENNKNKEFKIVRGELETNKFILNLINDIQNLNTLGKKIIETIN